MVFVLDVECLGGVGECLGGVGKCGLEFRLLMVKINDRYILDKYFSNILE